MSEVRLGLDFVSVSSLLYLQNKLFDDHRKLDTTKCVGCISVQVTMLVIEISDFILLLFTAKEKSLQFINNFITTSCQVSGTQVLINHNNIRSSRKKEEIIILFISVFLHRDGSPVNKFTVPY